MAFVSKSFWNSWTWRLECEFSSLGCPIRWHPSDDALRQQQSVRYRWRTPVGLPARVEEVYCGFASTSPWRFRIFHAKKGPSSLFLSLQIKEHYGPYQWAVDHIQNEWEHHQQTAPCQCLPYLFNHLQKRGIRLGQGASPEAHLLKFDMVGRHCPTAPRKSDVINNSETRSGYSRRHHNFVVWTIGQCAILDQRPS